MSVVQDHPQAFLSLLATAPGTPALVVYDGQVPIDPVTKQSPDPRSQPYVVAYFTLNTPDASAIEQVADRVDCTAYLHCVGGNAAASRAVAGRARAVLLAVTPTIAGRVCWPIRHTESQPPQRDESTGRLVFDLVDVYRLSSLPG